MQSGLLGFMIQNSPNAPYSTVFGPKNLRKDESLEPWGWALWGATCYLRTSNRAFRESLSACKNKRQEHGIPTGPKYPIFKVSGPQNQLRVWFLEPGTINIGSFGIFKRCQAALNHHARETSYVEIVSQSVYLLLL